MSRVCVISLIGMSALVLALSGPGRATTERGLSFTTIEAGKSSGVREAAQMVIRDAVEWAALWRRHAGASLRPMPAVDFDREMVIAVFAGTIQSPHVVSVARIVPESGRLVVWYTLMDRRPLPDGEGVTPSTPFVVVRLARSPLPVRFAQVKTPQVNRSP